MAVDLELPERPSSKPVVIVAVQDDRGLVVDAAPAQQLLKLLDRHNVAAQCVAELCGPVPSSCARRVALVVRSDIDIDCDDANSSISCVLCHPGGGHENVRNRGSGHHCLLRRAVMLSRARPAVPPVVPATDAYSWRLCLFRRGPCVNVQMSLN